MDQTVYGFVVAAAARSLGAPQRVCRSGIGNRRLSAQARHGSPHPRCRNRDPAGALAQHADRRKPAEALRQPRRRQGRLADGGKRRGRGPARPQRRRQDHLLLHGGGPGAARRRRHHGRRQVDIAPADPPARAARPVVPAAGSVGLPQADGRGEHPRGARTAARRRRPSAAEAGDRRPAVRAAATTCRSRICAPTPRCRCRAASGAASRSRARWRRGRASSCSTSRSPASTRSRCSRSSASSVS